jgi:pimeloyl-ACP methyl ester carboxylesterase
VKILLAIAIVLLGLMWLLWTPDKPRPELEARYARGPGEFMTVAGMRMHVRISGPADAPTLILLHGFGASLQTWDAWAALLPEYRLVRFDLPGCGLTAPDPTGDYTDARSEQVIIALMDALGVRSATLVGHSIGGRIAWHFAADHPGRVERLVLISPDGFASPGFAYGQPARVSWLLKAMRFVLPKFMLKGSLMPGYADKEFVTDALVTRYHDLMRAPGAREAMLARLEQTLLVDPAPVLARIQAPTLLLWGTSDGMIPFANATDYQRALPHNRLVALPGAGHLPHEEAAAASIVPLRQFLLDTRAPAHAL